MQNKQLNGLRWVAATMLGASLAVAAIGQQATADDAYEWPRYFNVITPAVGTGNHSLGVAWTTELSSQKPTRARVLPAPNGFSRASWLNTDEGRVVLMQASEYYDQMDAVDGFASRDGGPADTRAIALAMVTPWGYMVRGDSDIEGIHDIGPGTRIAYAGSSAFLLVGIDALLAYLDLDHDEVELVEVGSFGANTAVVTEGRADVAITGPIAGPSYEAEASPHGIRWLELPEPAEDPEAYERYRSVNLGYVPMEVSSGAGTAHGLNMDHAFQMYHVRGDDDPDFVYHLVKWMDEAYDSFKGDFTHAHMMSLDNLVLFLEHGAMQPLHEGAIRYLEEKGLWSEAFQERQDALVELAQSRVASYQEAMALAVDQGINVSPGNESWVNFWQQYREENGIAQPYGELVRALD